MQIYEQKPKQKTFFAMKSNQVRISFWRLADKFE